jgi:hypothetical protein
LSRRTISARIRGVPITPNGLTQTAYRLSLAAPPSAGPV